MYISDVVTGKIIEIHADRVLTQQGDMLCTYHARYYILPDKDIDTETEYEYSLNGKAMVQGLAPNADRVPKKRWTPVWPWFLLQKKSANRM